MKANPVVVDEGGTAAFTKPWRSPPGRMVMSGPSTKVVPSWPSPGTYFHHLFHQTFTKIIEDLPEAGPSGGRDGGAHPRDPRLEKANHKRRYPRFQKKHGLGISVAEGAPRKNAAAWRRLPRFSFFACLLHDRQGQTGPFPSRKTIGLLFPKHHNKD
jgi:hypothetical protein